MKRTHISAIALTLALAAAILMAVSLLAGCSAVKGLLSDIGVGEPGSGGDKPGPGAAIPIAEVLDADMQWIYENRSTALPVAVIYIYQGEGERIESALYGEDAVNDVLDAILEIRVLRETDITVADNDKGFYFINADGTHAGGISFNGSSLEIGGKKYEIEGKDALNGIDFPAESERDSLTLDGPDPRLTEFLERCQTEAPVSVAVVRDANEYEITDAQTIEAATQVLYSVNFVGYSYQGAEPAATSFTATFKMQDGWEYSVTFYDDAAYIYEYPAPLGPWSFYTDGVEYFTGALEGAQ